MQDGQMENWYKEELLLTTLPDSRLTNRFLKLVSKFSKLPESSINESCEDWSNTKAAYRFFQNERINARDLLSSHTVNTVKRASEHEVILAIQDTSYITYSKHNATKGLCTLTSKKGINKKKLETKGLIMHSSFGVSGDGLPIGLLDQTIYSRKELPEELKAKKKSSHGNALSIVDKESMRWLKTLQNTERVIEKSKTKKIVTVCDREGDMYDFFEMASKLNSLVLVRASQKNRRVNKKSRYSSDGNKLYDVVKAFSCVGEKEVDIPSNGKTKARTAKLEISFGKFTMNPSKNNARHKTETLLDIPLYAIHVIEKNCPEDCEALEWLLLTNMKVENFSDAVEKVGWYCLRWRIEVFHKILKSGLKVEECRLGTAERLIKYLTVMSIIAWRIFYITLLSRTKPNLEFSTFLSKMEWKILYINVYKSLPSTDFIPTIKDIVIWIAKLGGYLARNSDPEPGPIVMWRGLRRLSDLVGTYNLLQTIDTS